jgi:hypothetical protein
MPLLGGDVLEKRIAAVAAEREKIRQRERERASRGGERASLRVSPKQYMQAVVEKFNLLSWLGEEAARAKLVQAGYRGQSPYVVFLFFRMVAPTVTAVGSLIYVFLLLAVRHRDGNHAAGDRPGKPRHAHDGGRKESRRAAAAADRADDPVLSAGAVHRDPGTGHHQDRGHLQVTVATAGFDGCIPEAGFPLLSSPAKAGDPVSRVVPMSARPKTRWLLDAPLSRSMTNQHGLVQRF